uniref:Uncharacterized protein n=1 Tax=Oryza brachyantha TaxID=4533 RepID=J3KU53_ORYBR
MKRGFEENTFGDGTTNKIRKKNLQFIFHFDGFDEGMKEGEADIESMVAAISVSSCVVMVFGTELEVHFLNVF